MATDIKVIAFYLPQFHPIPENDEWWGKGFTEWTNTAKARPLFRGHYQPHVPADLGFYDLRLPEARQAQADLAAEYGLFGFCFYHYWFAGRRLLETPVQAILDSGQPDFPFCLCWANESWTGIWHGAPERVLLEQTYPGDADHIEHFGFLVKAFSDPRYIRVDGKPMFVIYRPWEIPGVAALTELWNRLARGSGLPGLYLVAVRGANRKWNPGEHGFDATVTPRIPVRRPVVSWREPLKKLRFKLQEIRRLPTIYSYSDVGDMLLENPGTERIDYPCVVPNWDNTPRSGADGLVLTGSTPRLFRRHLRKALDLADQLPEGKRIIFVKSWNEWAEGNHLEPDLRYGRGYLEVIRDELAGN
ncbi:glycoside hydrolase family 99-like domain-containing protein [Methylocaldum sp.]|uniref:glycosyltransferase WbsX family protein n=1 Tax=Methylocaldum sp. TaxID=1969727 RepID=UPI0032201E21